MPRFFVDGRFNTGDIVPIEGGDAHKITAVLRLRDGDAIEVIDSAAHVFDARVCLDGRSVSAGLGEIRAAAQAPRLHVTIAQGVPKAQKMDYVVEKLTELGAAAIVPLQSERTIVEGVSDHKRDRWRRLAKTAAIQCGRADVPVIGEPATLAALKTAFEEFDCVLFPWELAPQIPALATLEPLLRDVKRVLILIGPEGGFSHAEAELAQRGGAHLLWLGPRIVRTETAGLLVLAFVNLLSGG